MRSEVDNDGHAGIGDFNLSELEADATASALVSFGVPPGTLLLSESTLNNQITIPRPNLEIGNFSFPRYCPPVGVADKSLQKFLDEARAEHLESRFDISEPSLSRLLSDPPQTTLAFRLFHFISSAGTMPLHLFMGVFWVQYLILRVREPGSGGMNCTLLGCLSDGC